MKSSSNRRAAILDAAAQIVRNSGAGHLTIDAVAQASAVSKGGVLYHFPTKQALLEGMMDCLLEQMRLRGDALRRTHGQSRNPALVAHVLAEREQSPPERAMSRAILAAAAEDPELLAPARRAIREGFENAVQGVEPRDLGWVILLATEGMRFLEMLNLLPLSARSRKQVHERLLKMAQECGE
jgi:AcrR family transcriptional regulator